MISGESSILISNEHAFSEINYGNNYEDLKSKSFTFAFILEDANGEEIIDENYYGSF